MQQNKLNWKTTLRIAGAFIAYMIGSGFATGQEILQYFASYGVWGLAGITLCLFILLYATVSFVKTGFRKKFPNNSQIYTYYFGKFFGTFFDWFTVASIYLCYIVMLAGAGATLNQYFEIPPTIGSIVMGILVCITVMFGLQRMVDIIGKIGPVMIVLVIALGLITIFRSGAGRIGEAVAYAAQMDTLRASSSWYMAAFSYVGISVVWLATYMTALGGASADEKSVSVGAGAGVVTFIAGMFIMALALALNMDSVSGTQIPTLVLAHDLSPIFSTAFTVIIAAGIYTTAVPLLWTTTSRFAPDSSPRFRVLTCILSVVGMALGMLISFSKLVNVVYVLIGDLGFFMVFFIIAKNIRTRRKVSE